MFGLVVLHDIEILLDKLCFLSKSNKESFHFVEQQHISKITHR